MSSSVLYERLRELSAAGLVQREPADRYLLTTAGTALASAIAPWRNGPTAGREAVAASPTHPSQLTSLQRRQLLGLAQHVPEQVAPSGDPLRHGADGVPIRAQ